ncbi:MAG TPA: phosphotransferase, partial [Polyangiales bacterium]|nr:phosphotransferase [Polyangiales bacterium]
MLMPDQLEPAIELAQQWFGQPIDAVRALGAGASNALFEVSASKQRYYLRRYRRLRSDAVARQHALIRHARARGIPTPLPLDVRGESWLQAPDGAIWAMFEAAEGAQVCKPATHQQLRAAGHMLAALHGALGDAAADALPTLRLAWDGPSWIERLERIRARILELPAPDATDDWALRRVEAQQQWLADADCLHAYEPQHAPQLIHGDYQLDNLFFGAERVSGIIDWDNAASMPRTYELARACFFMCEMRPDDAAALVAGYQELSTLSASEL